MNLIDGNVFHRHCSKKQEEHQKKVTFMGDLLLHILTSIQRIEIRRIEDILSPLLKKRPLRNYKTASSIKPQQLQYDGQFQAIDHYLGSSKVGSHEKGTTSSDPFSKSSARNNDEGDTDGDTLCLIMPLRRICRGVVMSLCSSLTKICRKLAKYFSAFS